LPKAERLTKGLGYFVHTVCAFDYDDDAPVRWWDHVMGIAQALVDKETAMRKAHGENVESFTVSDFAFVFRLMMRGIRSP